MLRVTYALLASEYNLDILKPFQHMIEHPNPPVIVAMYPK